MAMGDEEGEASKRWVSGDMVELRGMIEQGEGCQSFGVSDSLGGDPWRLCLSRPGSVEVDMRDSYRVGRLTGTR